MVLTFFRSEIHDPDHVNVNEYVHVDINTPAFAQPSQQAQNKPYKISPRLQKLADALANATCQFLTISEVFNSEKKLDSFATYLECQQIGIFFSTVATCFVKYFDMVISKKLSTVMAFPVRGPYNIFSPTLLMCLEFLVCRFYEALIARILRCLNRSNIDNANEAADRVGPVRRVNVSSRSSRPDTRGSKPLIANRDANSVPSQSAPQTRLDAAERGALGAAGPIRFMDLMANDTAPPNAQFLAVSDCDSNGGQFSLNPPRESRHRRNNSSG